MWTFKLFVVFPLIFLSNLNRVNCDTADSDVINAIPHEVSTEAEVLLEHNVASDEPVDYRGAQLWRVSYQDQQNKKIISKLQKQYKTSVWNIQMANSSNAYVDLFVKTATVDDAKEFMENEHIPYDVIMTDVQDAIDNENPPLNETDLWQDRDGRPMTWTSYHRLEDIYLYLDFLVKSYPNLCSIKVIGKTYENRAIKVLRISNGNPTNAAVWIDAGIHAREWISPAAVTYVMDHLTANWDSETSNMKSIDWYFLPVMNPDGYVHTYTFDRLWRKNKRRQGKPSCYGVDLNRNYGHKWGGQGSSRQPCSETFAGSGPFSEPETKAVQDFLLKSAANFRASLSFHSYGQYILYPWGYDRLLPADHQELDRVGKAMAAEIYKVGRKIYTVGPAGSTLYPAAGGSDDWAKGDLKIKYSYTVELRDEGRYGFMLPANQIIASGEEALAVCRVIAKNILRAE